MKNASAGRGNKADDDEMDLLRAAVVHRGPKRQVRMPLRALREAAGFTQAQVAKASGIAQGDVSKLEREASLDRREIRTLRQYLSALGDEVEVAALSKLGHRIALIGAQASPASADDANADSPSQIATVDPLRLVGDEPTVKTRSFDSTPNSVVAALSRLASDFGFAALSSDDRPEIASKMVRAETVLRALFFTVLWGDDAQLDRLVKVARATLPKPDVTVGEMKAKHGPAALRHAVAPKFDGHRQRKRGQKGGDMNKLAALVRARVEAMKSEGCSLPDIAKEAVRLVTFSASGLNTEGRTQAKIEAALVRPYDNTTLLDPKAFTASVFSELGCKVRVFKSEDQARMRKRKRAAVTQRDVTKAS